jgi:hypothetical protein
MKIGYATFLACALSSLSWANESPSPTLHGVAEEGAVTWVLLRDADTPKRWVKVGESFGRYRVEAWGRDRQAVALGLGDDQQSWWVPLTPEKATRGDRQSLSGVDRAALREELHRLAVSACQHLLEQGGEHVVVADLVGAEKSLARLEALAVEDCAQLAFALGPNGLELIVAGKAVALPPASDALRIQVGPTLSLPKIAACLRLPLATLRELNPGLDDAPFTEAKTVRLQ